MFTLTDGRGVSEGGWTEKAGNKGLYVDFLMELTTGIKMCFQA